jgi:uncharacterized cupredoxin-like copper-binding protein
MVATMKEMVGLGEEAAPSLPPPKPGAKIVRVAGEDFSFAPDTIRLRAGHAVDIAFQNRGQSPHTFSVQALGFELKADPGQSSSGELGKLKPGRYEFICSIPGHAQLGMKGTLIVTK